MRWPSYPPTPLPKKGIRCHHLGQHHDMYITCNIFYNTTSKYINSTIVHYNEKKKLVHQSIVHKLLPKNYRKESLITSRCRIFPSFYFSTNQFGIRNYQSKQMNPNINLSQSFICTNLCTCF